MQDNSDQFASHEEEAEFHEEVIGTDDQEEIQEDSQEVENNEESEDEAEQVKPKKKEGFVEFTTPEQKARVAQLTREKHENARKAEALARELEQYKKEPEPPKEVPAPTADPVTDPELFARQQQERDKYIREHTKFESESELRKQAKQQAENQRKEALVDGYLANRDRLKINPAALAKASDVCAQYGITGDHPLVEELLEDKEGPAIVKFLAENPEHLAEIAGLKPTRALAYIEREVRAKLNVKKQSKAPPPPTKVSGTRQSSSSTADGWSIS